MSTLLIVGTVVSTADAANAASGYSLSSGSSWNVRSCPATCSTVGSTISGSIPDLVCQTSGPAVTVSGFGTSTIYDMVRTPAGILGYISDLGVAQTLYAQFTPGLPRCSAASPSAGTEAAAAEDYSWIAICSGEVWAGEVWACFEDGLTELFLPGEAD